MVVVRLVHHVPRTSPEKNLIFDLTSHPTHDRNTGREHFASIPKLFDTKDSILPAYLRISRVLDGIYVHIKTHSARGINVVKFDW